MQPIGRIVNAVLLIVAGFVPSLASESRPNVLLICVDDLRPELNSFGVDYIDSPNIDRLASMGRAFHRHYVQAPTCGASRYTLLTGRYGGASNNAIFARAAQMGENASSVPPSMPAWFRRHGYTTVSVGKVSHHPGGRGGKDWNDASTPEMPESWDRHLLPAGRWQHPRGWMHGLAHGEIRVKAGEMDVLQTVEGPDANYPDGVSIDEALRQLDLLCGDGDKPFFLAAGILRPHLPFGAPAKYLRPYADTVLPAIAHPEKPQGKTTWHGSGEFMKYNRWGRDPNQDASFATTVRRHYAACVSFADAQVGRLIERLSSHGRDRDTIIVLWGDHGWHLGEHAVWGKHTLFEESLRSPLVIVAPEVDSPGSPSRSIVETLDIFPTLSELSGLPKPAFAHGVSLVPLLKDSSAPGHAAIAYSRNARTIRDDRYRMIAHEGGHVELYDHGTDAKETLNRAASHPDVVDRLSQQLNERLALRDADR